MHLLAINLYELGQFLRIVGWVFLPIFVIVLLITTYLHHRRKRKALRSVPEMTRQSGSMAEENMEQPDEDNVYKGMLWMKGKFEEYRVQADERVGALKEELAQAREKIAELTGQLETSMSLLLNAQKELDRSLVREQPLTTVTPEAAIGGPGELAKE